MNFRVLIFYIVFGVYFLYGNEQYIVGIVKTKACLVMDSNNIKTQKLKIKYPKGTIFLLDGCDKYGWCKIRNNQLFVPKFQLAIETFENSPFESLKKLPLKKKTPKCIELKKINIDENVIFDLKSQNQFFQKYVDNKCIDGKILQKVLHEINQYYFDKGFVTTKPYLMPQNIKDGIVDVNVSVGKIEKIIDSKTKETTRNIKVAFIGQENEVLNLRDIETSLESINRTPSSKSTFKIKPSSLKGYSVVALDTAHPQAPYDFTIGASGSKSFNDKNPSLISTLSLYNLLEINDIFKFTLNGSYIQKEYQSSKGHEINYSFPIGSYIVELIKSYSTYKQGVDGINDTYYSKGKTDGYKLRVSKIIYRNQTNKLQTALSINHSDRKNYFNDIELETSSYKTTKVQLDLIHTWLQNWGQIATTYSISQGKDWLGARGDDYRYGENDFSSDASLEFTKYVVDSNLYYSLYPSYSIVSNFHYQYSPDNLYSADRLSLGSDYSVRGYSGEYFGNTGWYLHNDFIKDLALNLSKPLLKNLSFVAGVDYGKIHCQEENSDTCGEMIGSGVGFRTSAKHFTTDLAWNRPIKKLNNEFDRDTQFKWTVTMKF